MRLQTAGQTQQLSFSLTSPQLLYNIKKKKKNFETSLDTFKKLLKFIIIINVKSREKTQCNDNKKARDLDLENWDTHFDSILNLETRFFSVLWFDFFICEIEFCKE